MQHLRREHGRAGDPRRCRGALPRRAARRGRPGAQAQDHRPACSSRCSTRSRTSSRACDWLAQGTIYPDVIESAGAKTGKAHVIKSHHNVGGLPEQHEAEAGRAAARAVQGRGAPARRSSSACRARWCIRHPFPGPGLGVRILGEVTQGIRRPAAPGRPHLHRRAARARSLRQDQPGVRGVPAGAFGGRHGRRPPLRLRDRPARRRDHRLHDRALGAAALRLPRPRARAASSTRCKGISRVIYDISGKPPATIEWE